jgi:hypothetical protein
MRLKSGLLGRIAVAATMLLLAGAAAQAGSLEGHWVLVEQNYGKGGSNLAPLERPVHIEFLTEGSGLTATIWAGEGREAAVSWPAVISPDGLLPIDLKQRRIDRGSGTVRAEYEVRPESSEGLVLRIVEEYRLSEKGAALSGTTEVSFLRDGEPRGSYTLHRRFERRP